MKIQGIEYSKTEPSKQSLWLNNDELSYYKDQKWRVIGRTTEGFENLVERKQDVILDSADIEKQGQLLVLSDSSRVSSFNKEWEYIGGKINSETGKYTINNGKELSFDEAVERYKIDEFIKQWNMYMCNRADVGKYNESTGLFELNGITDIKYREAWQIVTNYESSVYSDKGGQLFPGVRTNIPYSGSTGDFFLYVLQYYSSNIQVVGIINPVRGTSLPGGGVIGAFCYNLERVISGAFRAYYTSFAPFPQSSGLKEIKILITRVNDGVIDLNNKSLLSLESFRYMVDHATKSARIRVHAKVYDKLTDETNEEWHKVWTDGLAKNITFYT